LTFIEVYNEVTLKIVFTLLIFVSIRQMAITNATILIPDISGFTHFMSMTELEHGSHLISDFLETIIQNVDENFEISEIEGDAVLLYKKGNVPSKQEVLNLCIKMFHAFHYKRKMIQKLAICPCGACQSLINLSLKFITHYGSLLEIKVDRFTKASGLDMIIAHRIMKNSVPSNEYILLTENFLKKVNDGPDTHGLSWQTSADEFPFIGKVNYEFALLEPVKKAIPDPPMPDVVYEGDNTPFLEFQIGSPYKDLFIVMIDMAKRVHWSVGLKNVEQESDHAYVGSIHYLVFDDARVKVSPIKMVLDDNEILYSEMGTVVGMSISVIYEYRLINMVDGACLLACRVLPESGRQLSPELYSFLHENLKISINNLKAYAENGFRAMVKDEVIKQEGFTTIHENRPPA
jgi:hypothetical protein